MTEQARWRLKSIKIRSFRGVADEQTYVFDGMSGLLHGNNGVGKSTAAQSVQWTIYGKFPPEVLQNTAMKGFLSPVSASADNWYGQVTLLAGDREMVITRDQKSKEFAVDVDGNTYTGPEAEYQRDDLLRLDMAGFVRTVLLQQSRTRGLLLDAPKERNAALDRLLGMDDIENILACLKPKDFENAAAKRREDLFRDQREHEIREQLLVTQRDQAQQQARANNFLNKDFSSVGIRSAYAGIDEKLRALANRYEVELEPLPPCSGSDEASVTSAKVDSALRALRTKSSLQLKMSEADKAIATYTALNANFERAGAVRDKLLESQDNWFRTYGEHQELIQRREQAETDQETARTRLKAAGELRQLLADARDVLEKTPTDHCPVCKQSIASASALIATLSNRMNSAATDEIGALEKQVAKTGDELATFDTALRSFSEQEKALREASENVENVRTQVVEAFGGQGISESKVKTRLEAAIQELTEQRNQFADGAKSLEDELAEIQGDDKRIRNGLLPVLNSRVELANLEDHWKKTSASHADAEAAAAELESTADRLTQLRAALLDAKNDLASSTLSAASPRANELYRLLVRHPVFDQLTITTAPKANKIDYSFEVSSTGNKSSAREARLVLSDGQVTATAIGLFFALADAETHGLDLLYIDDPTQNLDLPCKEAMARVVTEISAKRQVVVSTQDEDFVSFLEAEGFFENAVVHHLERWNGNPTVKTRIAG